MGAWGIGSFENDTACDWAYELEEQRDLTFVEETLDRVLESGEEYLDASESEEALAAAETLAKMLGRGGQSDAYTETVDKWVAEIGVKPSASMIQKAVAAIDRIQKEPSELLELWEESEDGAAWKEFMKELRGRLNSRNQ